MQGVGGLLVFENITKGNLDYPYSTAQAANSSVLRGIKFSFRYE